MSVIQNVKRFKKKYPLTIAWRLKSNAKIVDMHLNPDEEVKYVFAGQKNNKFYDIFSTCVIAITNKRILIGRKRVIFGYMLDSVMPYMYNDLNIRSGLIWGKVFIDTVKEYVILSNISNEALTEIETEVSTYMMEEKKKYVNELSDGD